MRMPTISRPRAVLYVAVVLALLALGGRLLLERDGGAQPTGQTLSVLETESGVTICAVYPSRRSDRPNECRPGGRGHNDTRDNDVEVDFDVKVPAGVKFVGRSVNGAVEAEGLAADARVYSVNGDVRVASAGVVEASTVNGSVTLTMPADVNAELEIGTVNGSIDTDFPIMVSGKMNPQSLRGRLGKGGRDLEIKTVNGSIRLRKG